MQTTIQIDTASVKVMRSHDYCHFEVALSSTSANTPEQIDELRKTAARLADKAVEQYKIAKAHAESQYGRDHAVRMFDKPTIQAIREKAETDRSPEEMAQLKAYDDAVFAANRRFDYGDDWEQDDDDRDDED